MRMYWLATTAIALTVGTGAALAQSSADHSGRKHEEKAGVQSQAGQRDTEHASERARERTTGQATDKAGNREERQSETSSHAEHGKQAQEPSGHESHESRQSQQEAAKREHTPSTAQEEKGSATSKQSNGQEHARQDQKEGQKNEHAEDSNRPSGTRQATEQQNAREGKKGQQAQENKQPSETKQSQQERDHGKEQAGQRTEPSTQQSGRTGETNQKQGENAAQPTNQQKQGENASQPTNQQKQGENASQPANQTNHRAEINDNQRKEISQKLSHEKTSMNQNVNIRVNVGERLPQRVDVRPLPPDIVSIAPQYRDYDYTVIDNRIAIVDPHSRDVVEYVDEGSGYGRSASNGEDRISFSDEERNKWRDIVRHSSSTIGSTASSSSSGGSTCLSLQPVPEEMVRDHPELRNYRYLAVGDDAVLVDPQQNKVVQVID